MPPVDRSRDRDYQDDSSDDLDAGARPRHGGSKKLANPLQRGSACLSCRKRKMKCDATKPVCRQCVKANRAEECEYDDGRQKSRTQILQEKIAKLEDRIRELEQPTDGDAFPDGLGFGDPGDEGRLSGGVLLDHHLPHHFDNDVRLSFAAGSSSSDMGLGFDATAMFGHGHALPQHSPSGSASTSSSSTTSSYSPLSLGAPGPLPLPPSSSFDASSLTPNSGIFDPSSSHFATTANANSPASSIFFGLAAPSPPSTSSSSRASASASGEGPSSSRQNSNSNRSSWQPTHDIFSTLAAQNPNENVNSLTGSPFPVDISTSSSSYSTFASTGNSPAAATTTTTWAAAAATPGSYFAYGLAGEHGAQLQQQQQQQQLLLQRHWWEAKELAPQNRKMLYVRSPVSR